MNLEEAQDKILELEDELKTIKEQCINQQVSIEELTKRNLNLQEHNQKLFLRVTSQQNIIQEPQEKEESIQDFLNSVEL